MVQQCADRRTRRPVLTGRYEFGLFGLTGGSVLTGRRWHQAKTKWFESSGPARQNARREQSVCIF